MNNDGATHDNLCSFALRLHGDNLDPSVATTILGLQPSKSWKKNDEFVSHGNKRIVRKSGLWAYKVRSDSQNLSVHINDFLSNLHLEQSVLDLVPAVDFAEFSIFFASSVGGDGSGSFEFEISSGQLMALAKFGIRLTFDISISRD